MSEWRPIETALRDGTRVLLWCDGKAIVGFYLVRDDYKYGQLVNHFEKWVLEGDIFFQLREKDPVPTHWMPLPDGPNYG